ncbi:alanine--tRNA ligase [Candidatus Parcubacteria bacterium]|nr:alanine--tRNA ligase [Candidatus Parcubacteria bacterium]
MESREIRQKFLEFFEGKGHKVVPSSPLVTDDPSVLFTTAGMQQFKPYYLGVKDPMSDFGSKNTVSVQKSVRTSDIEEVGDERHLTFFEMLGNFSFGGYWKKEAIEYAHEFVTEVMGLKIDYVTIFEGEEGVPKDEESERIWKSIDPSIRVRAFGRADNFWGPTGTEGPCGPTTEIYVDGIEIWNIVFNEFYQSADKTLRPLDIKGIDTGMGLERLAMVSQEVQTVFDTDLFVSILSVAKSRIVADHVRSAVFMISDGVRPSNSERGYVLRRLIRRAFVYQRDLKPVVEAVVNHLSYKDFYEFNLNEVWSVFETETNKFKETLDAGLKEFEKGRDPFVLFTSYGFPLELTKELAKEKGIEINEKDFEERFKKHQEMSRRGMEAKFKGGLAGHSDKEVQYHTVTHLLHQALRDVLGHDVSQKGSNITPERLRFDFAFPRKMTDEEKKRVEEIVNEKISEALPVNRVILPKAEAEKTGALHFFGDKYGDEISVYYIGDSMEHAYSKEFCGGPHVSNTSELGKFKIQKEEAVSAGVRRIKAVLE